MNDSLEIFLSLLPCSNVVADEDGLRYRFRLPSVGRFFEKKANDIIIKHGLKLSAELKIWQSRGIIHEITLIVQPVPEPEIHQFY